ncbi:MAG: sn-glycerol-3-phosphate ABC transporter ATP-binding protein UgpC [Rhizobiales bacterium]|nr:sn-glycerol-3-phosphate ABC transporter ATP-binding protein UgpC [Hyphomicrobiales bacterium]NRB13482.1 sn-glycerol-3-phosphate ABC transporter ATP-binding protein UgpC [Hyphomicrobiales bacterium]
MGQLKLENLKKSFGNVEVIKGVSLDVKHGEFIVFVGPSGCGKSTLLRMIAGLEDITDGNVIIDDVRVNSLPPVKRGIAMVFQSYALYPHMNVYENIAFPLRVEKLKQAEIDSKVHKAAEILKLTERLNYRPGELSGGQRQRVAIGRAIVREPSIFLFDEPLSNLDAALRASMRIELSKLHNDLDATMIYVTHDQIEAMTMADRIVVLDGGYISQVGTPLELYHNPENIFVAGFIGNPKMNFIDVTCMGTTKTGVKVQLPTGEELTLPVAPRDGIKGQTLSLGIRPEHTLLDGADIKLTLNANVVERLGVQTVVYANSPGGEEGLSEDPEETNRFCSLQDGLATITPGQDLEIGLKASDCHLFDANGAAFKRSVDLLDSKLPDM